MREERKRQDGVPSAGHAGRGRGRGCCGLSTRMRGATVLTPLVVLMTLAMFALMFDSALLAPQFSLRRTLDAVTLPIADAMAADIDHGSHEVFAYGACGDICVASGGACRHIVLRDGLHGGDRVSLAVLLAAETCH